METSIDITNLLEIIDEKSNVKTVKETLTAIESLGDLFHLPYDVVKYRIKEIKEDVIAIVKEAKDYALALNKEPVTIIKA